MIFNHLNQIYDPGTTLFIQDKLVDGNEQNKCLLQDIKIAIHLHTYYIDILDKYMLFLNDTDVNFDLYITTDTPEKKDAIHNYLKNQACFSKLKEIIITETHGRDVIPWLSIKDRLNQYDIVGHFHTKKSLHLEEWMSITWLDDILYSLLYNIKTIINEFMSNDNLGIIIPEVPYILRNEILNDSNVNLIRISENLWKRLKCNKTLDFKVIKNIIFPMGNMFWYRPAALKPLFELRLLPGDIPQEPLPNETILHSIERLVVYIAWNEGYDYRISLPPKLRESNFVTAEKLYDTVSSLTYKTGELILTLPKAIKQFLKK
jgi:rhamnosyltransferase